MMKLYRSALMAGLVALGVAACGDNVEVIQPTPPAVPPPPPPVEATMAPASASVAVGGSVVFAVNASGGVSRDAATRTCASSNTGIATVSSTSAGCQATGIAAGGVTVTASVSKSGETVNVGAQLTVTSDDPGDDAFILIGAIGQGGKPAISPYSGQLDVTVNVERGDQTLDVLTLFVDGEAVATQNFHGPDMVAPEDEATEQAVHPITLSFNTAEYEEETGAVTFANGVHALSAQLTVVGSMDAINSPTVRAEFDNVEGVHIVADALGNSALNPKTGKRWYGGPDAMDFVITAVPVMYDAVPSPSYSPESNERVKACIACSAGSSSGGAVPMLLPKDWESTTSPSRRIDSCSSVWSPRPTLTVMLTCPLSTPSSSDVPVSPSLIAPIRIKAGSPPPTSSDVTVSWAPTFTVSPLLLTDAVTVTPPAVTPVA